MQREYSQPHESTDVGAVPSGRIAEKMFPSELGDRQAQIWEPLFAIAQLASYTSYKANEIADNTSLLGRRDWGQAARDAAIAIHTSSSGESSSNLTLLLSHVRDAFGDKDRISTEELFAYLINREDGPWAEWWSKHYTLGEHQAIGSEASRKLREFVPRLRTHSLRFEKSRSGHTCVATLRMRGRGGCRHDHEDDPGVA